MKIGLQCYIFGCNYTTDMINQFSNLKAIIFDLGGVIIDHEDRFTREAFAALSNLTLQELIAVYGKEQFFEDYEVGAIDDAQFRANIREFLKIEVDDDSIDGAWNAMLQGGIDADKFELLDQMANSYDLYVMSNTNSIHVRFFEKVAKHISGRNFQDYFKKVYYSHNVGERKPNAGAWQVIIDEQGLEPNKTLFIDDKKENTNAASQLGLQVFQNTNPRDWMALF